MAMRKKYIDNNKIHKTIQKQLIDSKINTKVNKEKFIQALEKLGIDEPTDEVNMIYEIFEYNERTFKSPIYYALDSQLNKDQRQVFNMLESESILKIKAHSLKIPKSKLDYREYSRYPNPIKIDEILSESSDDISKVPSIYNKLPEYMWQRSSF